MLRDVDLTVPAGQFVAVVGANGSGKSTLIRALVGLRPVTSGRVRLFGVDQREFTDWGRVGYVPQRAGAGSGVPASVWEVVASGRLVHRRLLRPLTRTDRRAVADALEVVGLAHRAADPVSTLSGGQQQRVLIARALVSGPDLLVLDEPTAGVDAANQLALADALATLSATGATVVLVTHELGPLSRLVERTVTVREGRIVDDRVGASDPYGHPHDHHHTRPTRHDHAPHLGAPVDGLGDPGASGARG
ncbi:metal ABC transporter ATP-binding protein [Nocardioides lentus]|uniref:Metal ABC transporter ATP-binding protein n=1 Tax=Nocardioides lentus TaxID=338077 RepID=A0ABP5B3U2_9ACTN